MSDEGPVLHSTGMEFEAIGKFNAEIEDPGKYKHLWTVIAMYRVNPQPEVGDQVHLDMENLLTIEGPGCYKCEQPYSEALARSKCRGSV